MEEISGSGLGAAQIHKMFQLKKQQQPSYITLPMVISSFHVPLIYILNILLFCFFVV